MMARHTKINTTKSFTFEIVMPSHFERGQSLTWYVDRAMALRRYFKPLSTHVSPGAIKDANEAVGNASQGSSKPSSHQNKTHRLASMPRCTAAIHGFSKQLGVESLLRFSLGKGSIWPKSAASGKLVRRAFSVSSPCLSRSLGDLCRHGTPSPLTPPKMTTLLTRVLARRRRIIYPCTRTYENKNTKIYSKGLTAIYTKICTVQNFPLYGMPSA